MSGCCSTTNRRGTTTQSVEIQRTTPAQTAQTAQTAQKAQVADLTLQASAATKPDQHLGQRVDQRAEQRDGGYVVTGMTCGHCVSSVTEEVSSIAGVREVRVDLASGGLTFTSDQPVSRDAVDAAVREAGYQLA